MTGRSYTIHRRPSSCSSSQSSMGELNRRARDRGALSARLLSGALRAGRRRDRWPRVALRGLGRSYTVGVHPSRRRCARRCCGGRMNRGTGLFYRCPLHCHPAFRALGDLGEENLRRGRERLSARPQPSTGPEPCSDAEVHHGWGRRFSLRASEGPARRARLDALSRPASSPGIRAGTHCPSGRPGANWATNDKVEQSAHERQCAHRPLTTGRPQPAGDHDHARGARRSYDVKYVNIGARAGPFRPRLPRLFRSQQIRMPAIVRSIDVAGRGGRSSVLRIRALILLYSRPKCTGKGFLSDGRM